MLMKTYILTTCALLFTVSLFAQSVEFTKYNFPNNKQELSDALSHVKAGDKFYDDGPGVYRLAIEEYTKAYSFNPNNALLNYKLGRCYSIDNDKTNAIKYLEKALELDPRISLDMEYNDANLLLAKAYHRDYQLLKDSLFPAIASLTDCLDITEFMFSHLEVNASVIDQPKYDLLFSVENVNALVNEGVPFREAYQQVGKEIEAGTFKPLRNTVHTHEGSIGNLCNEEIKQKFLEAFI